MNTPFRIEIPSSAPQIKKCEVLLARNPNSFNTGWMVTTFKTKVLKARDVVSSIVLNPSRIQITATLDPTKKPARVVALLGVDNPLDRMIVEIKNVPTQEGDDELVVYWENWKITKVEWNGQELSKYLPEN